MVMTTKEVLFNKRRNGIYYHDMEDHGLVLVNKVEENQEGLSRRDLSGTREARRALEILGFFSQKTFNHMVRTINNFPCKN